MELLMPFQSCWRVLVQPSCCTLPHIPWLSGVAVVQAKPPNSAAESAATGTASGNPSGSVVLRQPSVRTTMPTTPRAGCLIATSSWNVHYCRPWAGWLRWEKPQLATVGGTGGAVKHRSPSPGTLAEAVRSRCAPSQWPSASFQLLTRLHAYPLYPEPFPPSVGYSSMTNIELGLDTFGDVTADADGRLVSHARVLRDVIAEAQLADRVGVDFFGVGEHHRPDFAISAPEVLLAAIAGRTERLRLGTAVTVLSSDDPIRVYQRFSTLNAVSNGRAEVILGRGSFTESFPLFGYSLDDYNVLFDEKLAIFAALRDADRTGEPVRWKGTIRPPLEGVRVFPSVERPPLTTWIGVGGSP